MLEVVGATKVYGPVTALDRADIVARSGRLLGLLGPNGAGKTTAMRAVLGLTELDAGEIRWRGRPITDADRRGIGYLPEQRGLYPRMSLREQVVYFGRLRGLSKGDAARATARLLDRVGLADRADDRVEQLSHGNQQRAQLAVALVHDPDLLVLDEPFSGLDPVGVAAMRELILERAAAGATVVFSSHQLDLVQDLCEDVAIIAGGAVVVAGTLDEVRDSVEHKLAVVDLDGPVDALLSVPGVVHTGSSAAGHRFRVDRHVDPVRLLAAVDAAPGQLRAFRWEPPSLSEVFLDRVGRPVAEIEAEAAADEPTGALDR